jgi:hypothetical protein
MLPGHLDEDLSEPQATQLNKPAKYVSNDAKENTDPSVAEFRDGAIDEKADILHAPADITDVLVHAFHLHDDPSMPAITFRSMFLGVGLSVFSGVISGIYCFKPQTVILPTVFLGINSSIMMFFAVSFTSQWYIRKHHPNLFVRYNYLVSAALDGGTSVIVFILSFAVLGGAGAAVAFRKLSCVIIEG